MLLLGCVLAVSTKNNHLRQRLPVFKNTHSLSRETPQISARGVLIQQSKYTKRSKVARVCREGTCKTQFQENHTLEDLNRRLSLLVVFRTRRQLKKSMPFLASNGRDTKDQNPKLESNFIRRL